jgi:Family of unknown function (DUF5946)
VETPIACEGCGLVVAEGTDGCQALFEQELPREYSDYRYAKRHRMAVDTYAVQHAERYCGSGIRFAAHFAGLLIGLEYPDHPTLQRQLHRWLDTKPAIARPAFPPGGQRGILTIADVLAAGDPDEHSEVVERWARAAWDAYADLQPLAREWVAGVVR